MLRVGRGGCFLKASDSEGCNSAFAGPQEDGSVLPHWALGWKVATLLLVVASGFVG